MWRFLLLSAVLQKFSEQTFFWRESAVGVQTQPCAFICCTLWSFRPVAGGLSVGIYSSSAADAAAAAELEVSGCYQITEERKRRRRGRRTKSSRRRSSAFFFFLKNAPKKKLILHKAGLKNVVGAGVGGAGGGLQPSAIKPQAVSQFRVYSL